MDKEEYIKQLAKENDLPVEFVENSLKAIEELKNGETKPYIRRAKLLTLKARGAGIQG